MNLTPYQLGILLNIYVGAEIAANKYTDTFRETMTGFMARGLIENDCEDPGLAPVWMATEKLKVMMHHMLSTPDPVQVWEIPVRTKTKTRGEHD